MTVELLKNIKKDPQLAVLEEARRQRPILEQLYEEQAWRRWTAYNAYLRAGFSEADALYLCCEDQ